MQCRMILYIDFRLLSFLERLLCRVFDHVRPCINLVDDCTVVKFEWLLVVLFPFSVLN
jgi:hypothetical protein